MDLEWKSWQSWLANAPAWAEAVREHQIPSRQAGTDRAIVEAVLAHKPGRVLDLGCGEGWLARALAEQGVAVTGIDGSLPLVERARELGGGTFEVLLYEDLVAEPQRVAGPFDVIVCNFSLLGETIGPLLRALRPRLSAEGGLLIQTVHPFTACGEEPYQNGWRIETFANFGKAFPEQMPWYFRTVGSWLQALQQAGWRVTDLAEPLHPDTGRPLSLLLTAHREANPQQDQQNS
jgi:2-polyprenyl-3-methyl-5-hydroxy-6-metoxy-1,4-benzoquinol methylase